MNGLLIVGASGHGQVVLEAAIAANEWRQFAFVDDRLGEIPDFLGVATIGTIEPSVELRATYPCVVVAVGDARTRLRLLHSFTQTGFEAASIIHPRAAVSPSARIGPGTVVLAGGVLSTFVQTGSGCIVNTNASVDHHCVLGDGVHVAPGAAIAGDVTIGARSWVGIGASVVQGLKIGADATIGAGAAVISDVEDGSRVAGVPARVIEQR